MADFTHIFQGYFTETGAYDYPCISEVTPQNMTD